MHRLPVLLMAAGLLLTGSVLVRNEAADTSAKPDAREKAGDDQAKKNAKADTKEGKRKKDRNVLTLFDGKTLKGWKSTNFGGEGEVSVSDGAIVMEFGADMTGVTWKDEKVLPKINYEVSFEGKRIDGGDFFCGLTFPVKKSHCSLILGGWGGGVCGLSCLNGQSANENETTHYKEFKNGDWYKVRIRVLDGRIRTWVNGKEVIDVDTTDTKISIRSECDLSRPLGFATWQTSGAVRKIQIRRLTAEDLKKLAAEEKADR